MPIKIGDLVQASKEKHILTWARDRIGTVVDTVTVCGHNLFVVVFEVDGHSLPLRFMESDLTVVSQGEVK
jgi:hypothetical protein